MSALREAISHAALGWVKPELDETLRQARSEIEYFVDESGDGNHMRLCAGHLHQVQGTLRMVELQAPAMVAEELELLALALQDGQLAERDEACATLMRGTVLLPDYLERLQDGHRDIPIVLLPLLNEIRAARGVPGLNESVLFDFDPDAGAATEAELDHARGSLSGRNRELLDTVGTAVKEELLRVKDALDLHLRTGGDVAGLQPQVQELGNVADTLGMMGLGGAREVVVRQRDALQEIVAGGRQADEGLLLDIAGALLYVDASLDDQVSHLGPTPAGAGDDAGSGELRRTLDVLAQEAIANFAAAREHFVAFIETNWDHGRLAEVPDLLGEVGGALQMLQLPEPAAFMEGVRRYVSVELIGKQRVPSGRQLDTLADAMASLEYYLEALRERRPGREEILDITRSSLEALRYWPLPDASQAPAVEPLPVPEISSPATAAAEEEAGSVAPAPASWTLDAGAGQDEQVESPGKAEQPEQPEQAERIEPVEAIEPALAATPADVVDAASIGLEPVEPEAITLEAIEPAAWLDEGTTTEPVSLASISFDPVAAETEQAFDYDTPTIAPIQVEGLGTLEFDSGVSPTEPSSAFDPVAAEAPANTAASGNAPPAYTFDISLTYSALAPSPAAPAPLDVEDASDVDSADFTSLQSPAQDSSIDAEPDRAASTPEAVDEVFLPTQVEDDTPETTQPSAPAEVQVYEAVPSDIELDDASAAFLAELDAAAADFDPQPAAVPSAATVETPAPIEPVVESVAATSSTPDLEEASAGALLGGFEDSSGDIDQEIREVFLEEFAEEIDNLEQLLPLWRAAPADMEKLRPVRRIFHTLKGSGRLVGARVLGEFSWKIESLLNRVLDGSRPPSGAVLAIVEQARQVLPEFDAALRGTRGVQSDLPAIEAVAERVAAGEEAWYTATVVAPEPVQPSGTPASVDSVLREILEAEVATHLETVRAWLAGATPQPQAVTEALLRAIHTMNGAFAMTDVPEIPAVTSPAETYVKRSLAAQVVPSAEGVRAIADTRDAIASTIAALQAPSPLVPSFAALAARLAALVATLPEAAWPPQVVDAGLDEATDDAPPTVELSSTHDLSGYLDEVDVDIPAEAPVQAAEEAAPVPQETGDSDAQIAGSVAAADTTAADDGQGTVETADAEDVEAFVVDEASSIADADIPDGYEFLVDVDDGADADETLVASTAEATELEALQPDDAAAAAAETPAAAESFEAVDNNLDDVPVDANPEGVQAPEEPAAPLGNDVSAPESPAPSTLDTDADVSESSWESLADRISADLDDGAAQSRTPTAGEEWLLETLHREVPAIAPTIEDALPVEAAAESAAGGDDALSPAADVAATADGSAVPESVAATAGTPVAAEDAPLDFSELDRELVDIFVEEGNDLLDHCDHLLSDLRDNPQDRELLAGLQRDLHTLKGGARMAGINAIGDLGHSIESLLEGVADRRTELGRNDLHLLERGFDRLHQLLTRTGAHRAVAMPQDLVDAFNLRAQGGEPLLDDVPSPVQADEAVAAVAEPVTAEPEAQAVAEPQAVPVGELSPPVQEQAGSEEDPARAPHEQVRVRADLLDNLVNYAGEVAIYRSRLEQQLGAFRGAMAELDRTNARLRDQLRRLDLETEAQIVARYQREQDNSDQTFDPLELDRFSTLQQLSRALNESAADLGGLQGVLDDLARQYDSLLQQQSRVSSELQDGLMRARMVPFDGLVPRLRRVVRQAAGDTGKQVQLTLDGTHGELDRNVLDRMVASLEHMLRNAVAHGLETPEQRRAAGKPEEGTIAIRLRREGSEIVLEVADDGAGLDREAIRRRGEQRGLIDAGAQLRDSELDALIFASGFSTSDQVSQLAGRGVGMDVVRNEVRQLGGSVDIHSVTGRGVTFVLRLPQTLAVTQAVFVRVGDTQFAVPVASVSGIGRIGRSRFESGEGGYHYGGEDYTLYNLGSLVGQGAATAEGQPQVPLLLVRAGELRAAVAIDQVLGNREIVVKPVGLQIASVPGIYGATITGDGSVVVILDVAPLVRRFLVQPQAPVVEARQAQQRQTPLVMVVDDSLTMRKVTGRVLERHNLEVATARDGVEALELLEERVPDLMLLDIEMPRMDGYELATHMRADPRYKDVPIVMITSRSGDKHRQRAFEIGVQRYLGKPYQELDLMRNVYDLLGIARARE